MSLYRKKVLILIIFYLLCFNSLFFYKTIFADEETPEEEVISVAVFELGKSYFFDEKKNTYAGYIVDFMDELLKYENFKVEYVYGTWEESLEKVKNGEVDICPFVNISDEREEVYDFSKYSFGPDGGFLFTNRQDVFYDDFANFNGKRIGFIAGFQIKENFKKYALDNNFSYHTVLFDNESDMKDALEKGQIDMITAECMQQFPEYRKVGKFQMGEYYFVTAKGSDKIAKINNALSFQRWYNPDADLKIYKKYYNLSDKNPVFSRDEFDFIRKSAELTIAVLPNRFVQSNLNVDKKNFIGIEPDIIREIEILSGLKMKIISVKDGETLSSMVEKGYSDMAIGVSHIEDFVNNDYFYYSDVIIETPYTLAIRKNEMFKIDDDLTISIPKTFPSAKLYIRQEYPLWKVLDEYELSNRLDTLLSRESDCAIISRYELQYLLQMPKYRELTMYPMDFMNFDSSIIISKKFPRTLVSVLNKSIESVKYNTMETIINRNVSDIKYYTTFLDNITEYKEFVIIISGLLIGVFCILLYSYKLQKKKNNELEKYISDLNKTNDKLNIAYGQIKEAERIANDASRIKSDFMARMSHDMRTPMNAIISISDFGIEESVDEKDIEYFKQIKTSSLYLLGLLNDILETQKLESKEVELLPTTFNFSLLFNEIENIIKYRALRKHINFVCDFDNRYNNINIFADKKRLEQAIINIINNAIKYTKPFGKVVWKTRVKKYAKNIKIVHYISDTGVGMSEQFQSRMFDAFTQENNELSDDEFGTGLGLAIVKNIVSLMDGDIRCKSGIGKGTKFTITLIHELSHENLQDISYEKRYLFNVLAGKRVLVCEDNAINSKIILKILGKYGIITDLAENGRIGVEKTINHEYDLILMDIRMPIMDGLEAAMEIRRFNSKIPIIALSANAYDEDIQKSLSVGMNAHLAKPIDKDELFSQLAYWMIDA